MWRQHWQRGKLVTQDLESPRLGIKELRWSQTPVWDASATPSLTLHVEGQGLDQEEEKAAGASLRQSMQREMGEQNKHCKGSEIPQGTVLLHLFFARSLPSLQWWLSWFTCGTSVFKQRGAGTGHRAPPTKAKTCVQGREVSSYVLRSAVTMCKKVLISCQLF